MDEDHGTGNEDHFPAADLERLYKMGGVDPLARIRGQALNQILGTSRYAKDAWYVVTDKGVRKV